ncbi:hypothetical protein THOM_1493 [Trachipleistophora hominis]|uniref:Uncharacterized protein n=1 Tax=Trachipleistophora hominis TaxID=72359 RepID=L7JW60_TRAHO|nr:hypothetical protein THOM_1493 [Trachipleistophora hominis]
MRIPPFNKQPFYSTSKDKQTKEYVRDTTIRDLLAMLKVLIF